ncbi:ArsR family transcriptional regulator [Paraburkholderia sp. ZP32-5]|uniref:ArsR family transcriptional regulator n=1 Tax=Paraburkholderia sp. ZP32-5 TaxID=2883245 RepID=UPI001F2BBB23|nr:ArsR family transcriptional regulator [Paraburkholderia sp. ZP32-5]
MDDDDIDPQLAAILAQLWRAHRETPQRTWSLAKLSKQSAVPMSSLRRQLAALTGAGLVSTALNEDGTGSASLTELGTGLCAELFGDEEGGEAGSEAGNDEANDEANDSNADTTPPPRLH